MKLLLTFSASAALLLAGDSMAQAQYFHGHGHYHHGHVDYHGHWHNPGIYGYSAYGYSSPYSYGASWASPAYSYPSVLTNPVAPTILPAGNVTTSLRPNALPAYTGPGVTLRLPAEFPGSVFVRIDGRDAELKPGTELALRDKSFYLVEFDRGGDFGAASAKVDEGTYRFAVGDRGWQLMADPARGLRPNPLPGEKK